MARSRAADRQVLLLSDGVATDSPDPVNAASALARIPARLQVLALSAEEEAMASCAALAAAGGGQGGRLAPAVPGAGRRPGAARVGQAPPMSSARSSASVGAVMSSSSPNPLKVSVPEESPSSLVSSSG